MIIVCPSVQYSGHHFTLNRVFKAWWMRGGHHDDDYSEESGQYFAQPPTHPVNKENTILTGHFDDSYSYLYHVLAIKNPLCVPMVHPSRNRESWKRRNTFSDLPHGRYMTAWNRLIDLCDKVGYDNIHFLHLDDKEIREKQAALMQRLIGSKDEIDWSVDPEGTGARHGTQDYEITTDDLHATPEEFVDFYYETKKAYL